MQTPIVASLVVQYSYICKPEVHPQVPATNFNILGLTWSICGTASPVFILTIYLFLQKIFLRTLLITLSFCKQIHVNTKEKYYSKI